MIRAAHDFSLCTRRHQSCSLHATCARAQLGSADHARQRWCAPLLTGEACDIYHPFEPSRIAAANTMAESENLGRSEQSGAAHREDAGGSGSAVKLPARNEDRAESGVEVAGAGLSSAPAFPAIFPAPAGSHRQATTDHPAACGTLSAGDRQQLRAARVLNL